MNIPAHDDDIHKRSVEWEAGFRAGLAASNPTRSLDIAQALATAAVALANASQEIARAAAMIVKGRGMGPEEVAALEGVRFPLSEIFKKPTGAPFKKPPSTIPAEDVSNESPWTGGTRE